VPPNPFDNFDPQSRIFPEIRQSWSAGKSDFPRRKSFADHAAEPGVFHHAAKGKDGALRRGVAGHAQRGEAFVNVVNLPGCSAAIAPAMEMMSIGFWAR
jgi:hypothetical protein